MGEGEQQSKGAGAPQILDPKPVKTGRARARGTSRARATASPASAPSSPSTPAEVESVVISFATWMQHCEEQIPRIRELVAARRPQSLQLAMQRASALITELLEVLSLGGLTDEQQKVCAAKRTELQRYVTGRL